MASLVQTEARLLDRFLGGKVDQQVHDDLSARYSARRKGIRAKIDAISEEMQGISQEDDAVRSITSLKDRFWTNLRQMSQSQWRELLSALRTQIRIIRPLEDRSVPEWLAGVDFSHHGMTAISSSGVIVDFVLPQQTEEGRIANIVSGEAGLAYPFVLVCVISFGRFASGEGETTVHGLAGGYCVLLDMVWYNTVLEMAAEAVSLTCGVFVL